MELYNLQGENELCWDNEIAYFSISDQYWCNECGNKHSINMIPVRIIVDIVTGILFRFSLCGYLLKATYCFNCLSK